MTAPVVSSARLEALVELGEVCEREVNAVCAGPALRDAGAVACVGENHVASCPAGLARAEAGLLTDPLGPRAKS